MYLFFALLAGVMLSMLMERAQRIRALRKKQYWERIRAAEEGYRRYILEKYKDAP